ncbi:MAG: aminoacetone oxidase family FAD-binding enzyme, partial [Candidatus Aminicenantes bacterium]|nr:aminoacetone oxidase family FAD-binding enzyme [Candidatus Aminicenantes bacterium]
MKIKKKDYSNPLHNEYDLIIIGAGPAGLIAAIESNDNNVRIIVIEQKFKPAMKLRITGKGNCNITNNAGVEEFIENFGRNGKFLRQSFSKFFNEDLIGYFNELGVDFELERGGRYYPKSGKAETIADSLLHRLDDLNIEIVTNFKAEKIILKKSGEFEVELSYKDLSDGEMKSNLTLIAERILLATGGRSYPGTGSDGSGYALAEGLGHTIVPIIPALVPLKGKGNIPEELNGLSIRNCSVKVFSGDKKVD